MNNIAAITRSLSLTVSASLLTACASATDRPLPTVERVDLQRYAGTWYEVALLPNRFQRQCVSDSQANYTLEASSVRVVNRCRRADGSVEEIEGKARVVPGSSNSKLEVSFFWPFWGDYWIVALDADYRHVLVGEPGRKYAWLLSRTPNPGDAVIDNYLSIAQAQGFDRSAFVRTPADKPIAPIAPVAR
jgi:apolipoprotein D and lipocalin family protein